MDTNGLITLQSIVQDYMNEIDGYSDTQFLRYLRLAERCVLDLNVFTIENVSTEKVTVNKNLNTVPLPTDFARLIRLGVMLSNGRIYTLTEDEYLGLNKEVIGCDPCDDSLAVGSEYEYCGWKYHIRGGLSEYGTYRIDHKLNRIQLGNDVNLDEVIIEYTTSGINKTGETLIPIILRESIISWIDWKSLHRSKHSINERMQAERRYYNEREKLAMATMSSFDEIYDALLGVNSPLVNR